MLVRGQRYCLPERGRPVDVRPARGKLVIWQLISSGEKVLYHYLEVTVEANIYVVTSPPKFAPDATDMGILVETNSSPQKTSESHQPGGKVREREKKKYRTDWVPWDPF